MLDVNPMGVVHGIHAFLPHIRAHGEGGRFVVGFSPYSASKFAVVNISEGLAAWLRPLGIGVTVLCPGFIRTRINAAAIDLSDTVLHVYRTRRAPRVSCAPGSSR